ncbi:hypothetical protein BGX34_007408 [Mortierella sp. NVP85]|nr:hypothetical protein BGX34_007408 [Mortierella sp. NVP85]
MSETLTSQRTKLIPKPKFAFKSRKALAPGASSSSSSSSSLSLSSTSLPLTGSTKVKPSTSTTMTTTTTTMTETTVDPTTAHRFMKFENRSNEHLFIGMLQQEDTDPLEPMEQDVYLGRVPVDMSTLAASRSPQQQQQQQHQQPPPSPSSQQQQQTVEPKDVALTNLTDCTINLVHHAIPLGAIHIKNLKRCTLVIPPVSGSILLHDCEGCTLIGACHQSRMHTSTNMDIYLHVTSEPIIEDCTDMRFAPYPYNDILPTDQLGQLFSASNLNPDVNYYDRVKDFNWLRQQKSPNWRLLEPQEIRNGIAQTVLAKDASPLLPTVTTAATSASPLDGVAK